MAPRSWATSLQSVLLSKHIPLYETIQASTKQYQPLWDIVFSEFLEKWPILPPGVTHESLNEEESETYTKDLSKLYSRIKEWFRWRCNSRSRNTSNTVTSREMKDIYASGTRTAKEYEVFVKLNQGTFQPVYEAECVRQGVSGRSRLPIWHKVAAELWEKATEEQKVAVHVQITANKEAEIAEGKSPITPSDYQKYWEKLPAILSKTVAPPVRKAGVMAFITIVGPVPNAGGQILATTLQFGDKPETPLFSNTWGDHDRVLVDQLAAFAGRYEFSPELCSKRSLLHAQKSEDSSSGSGQISANEAVRNSVEPEGSPNLASSTTDDLPVGPPPPEPAPESTPDPLIEVVNTQPQSQATLEHDVDPLLNFQLLNFTAPVAASSEDRIDENADPYDLSKFTGAWLQDPMWADPIILETIISSNAPKAVPDNSFNSETATQHMQAHHTLPGTGNVHAPDLPIPNPVPATPPTVDAPAAAPISAVPRPNLLAQPSAEVPPTFQSPPTILTASQHAPVLPNFANDTRPGHGPNLSNNAPVLGASQALQPPSDPPASMPATIHLPNITLSPLPAPSGPSPAPKLPYTPSFVTPTIPATNMGTAPIQALGPNPLAASHDIHDSHPTNLSTPFSFLQTPSFASFGQFHTNKYKQQPPIDENAPPNTHIAGDGGRGKESDKRATAHAPPQDGTRRSRRPPVPSTRLDKLNEIGTNIIPPKALMNTVSENEEPFWFAPAYGYLRQSTLGPAWVDLVEKWAQYEHLKGWKSGKGLPAKGRPEEWQQWVSKARHGIRNYNSVPIIEDAADLGIAVSTWARSFSPSDFCKTGPHGTLVLLTLMFWWGTAALRPSSWSTDSRPQWTTLLKDLFDRFAQLDPGSATKRAREDDESHENKRPRVDA